MQTLINTKLSLPLLHRGKVRDIFDIDDNNMLIVTTDRLSAFDVVFDQPIPEKGMILTSIANYWFQKTEHIVQNHLTGISLEEVLSKNEAEMLAGRAIVVKKLRPLAIEAVIRGYLIGSGWKEYLSSGMVCGIPLPQDMKLAQQLLRPLYTPSSKAGVGEHDANISFQETETIVGSALASQIKDVSLKIYQFAAEHAFSCGIIIADTKFEFGLDEDNQLTLMDEVLTPDSSRFWSVADYQPGKSPKSYDKQIIRDYLETLDWDKKPPAPRLPDNIMAKAAEKYHQVHSILCN
ncbi:MAG: phosphoribosylaminoimidazolesuccinocarboxamide synthase [SAR324 cluster bacterium]|nr:phosphoribosylaminoimidazolesuccinocarboxamide synthase [SAR324 cluster bacterium]